VCWNNEAGLCEGCAPNLQEEMAAAHAQAKAGAAAGQLRDKAAKVNYVEGIDMSAGSVLRAPGPATAAEDTCTSCGAAMAKNVHFCPQCGTARAPGGCPGCGATIQANTKFCGQCGAKLA
jgi:hypothetical protein